MLKRGVFIEKIIKGNKGITVMALVVTIIVLIILASISISMISGDGGLLEITSESTITHEIGEYKDL